MNDRIRKLALQAGGNPNYKAFRGHFLPPPPDYIDPATVNLKKFAELIVRECIEQLVKEGDAWEQFSRNPPEGQETNAGPALFAAYRLKEDAVSRLEEHFGVKEPPVNDVDRILRTIRTRS